MIWSSFKIYGRETQRNIFFKLLISDDKKYNSLLFMHNKHNNIALPCDWDFSLES